LNNVFEVDVVVSDAIVGSPPPVVTVTNLFDSDSI
jgi:hypothetical protein